MSFSAGVSIYFSLVYTKDLEEVHKQTFVVYARKFSFVIWNQLESINFQNQNLNSNRFPNPKAGNNW